MAVGAVVFSDAGSSGAGSSGADSSGAGSAGFAGSTDFTGGVSDASKAATTATIS